MENTKFLFDIASNDIFLKTNSSNNTTLTEIYSKT